jgi:ATP-dependent RNA helicase DDX27
MANSDYVMTIDSDLEDFARPVTTRTQPAKPDVEDVDLSPEFVFDVSGDPYIDIVGSDADFEVLVQKGSKPVSPLLVVIAEV